MCRTVMVLAGPKPGTEWSFTVSDLLLLLLPNVKSEWGFLWPLTAGYNVPCGWFGNISIHPGVGEDYGWVTGWCPGDSLGHGGTGGELKPGLRAAAFAIPRKQMEKFLRKGFGQWLCRMMG